MLSKEWHWRDDHADFFWDGGLAMDFLETTIKAERSLENRCLTILRVCSCASATILFVVLVAVAPSGGYPLKIALATALMGCVVVVYGVLFLLPDCSRAGAPGSGSDSIRMSPRDVNPTRGEQLDPLKAELKERAEVFHATLQASRHLLGVIDAKGRILEVNDAGANWFNVASREDLVGACLYDLPPSSLREQRREMVRRVLDSRAPARFDGEREGRKVSVTMRPVLDDGREVSRIAIHLEDISQRLLVERSLRESEERFRRVFEEGPFGMAIFDPVAGITRVNDMFCRLLGYSAEELLGVPFNSFAPGEDANVDADQLEQVMRGELRVLRAEKRYLTKRGETIWVHLTASTIRGGEDMSPYGLAIIDDITESKGLREERERLIFDLRDALAKVKTLKGLIPICAWCKKVRNDQGYWMRIEAYLQEHSDADFTHGACPECASKMFNNEMAKKE